MKRIGMGLVGPGFVGVHHIDAVRRLGFVDVVAVAGSSEASARRKADALGVPKAYGSFEALAADPAVHVVHNTTPNYLHGPVIRAALAARKHIVSDKPLASTAAEARALWHEAREAGVVHAVTFNYRGNPLVQQARAMVADRRDRRGALRARQLPAGLAARPDAISRGASSRRRAGAAPPSPTSDRTGAISCSTCRPAHRRGAGRSRDRHSDAAAAIGIARGLRRRRATARASRSRSRARISRACSCASMTARAGVFSVGQICAGHKNDLWFELNGAHASLRWRQEQQNELWIGRRDAANATLAKDPSLLGAGRARVRAPAGRPSGGVGRRVPQRAARRLRVHRRRRGARRARAARVRDVRGRLPRGRHRGRDSREPRRRRRLDRRSAVLTWTEAPSMKLGIFTPVFGRLTTAEMIAKVRSLGTCRPSSSAPAAGRAAIIWISTRCSQSPAKARRVTGR